MPAACEGGDCDDDDVYGYGYDVVASSSEGSSSDYDSRLSLTLGVGKSPPLPLDCEETSASSSSSSSTLLSRAAPAAAPSSVLASTAPKWLSGQVVGWPPIRSYRMNAVINHAKPPHLNGEFGDVDAKSYSDCGAHNKADGHITEGGSYFTQRSCPRKSVYVKVNMDGFPIGRKIDLNAHQCYQSLANALDSMFSGSTTGVESIHLHSKHSFHACGVYLVKGETRLSKLLDGSSGYVLAYEDKEGDWLLVGDVPWGLFLNTVKRLRILRASAANGFDI